MRQSVLAALTLGMLAIGQPSRGAQNDPTVPTYHGDPSRTGHYVVPDLTWTRAASAHLDQSFDGQVQGRIYAQPLYWHPPDTARGLLIVVTEANTVHALDAQTGREVWRHAVGSPVARSSLWCGNIDPLGITGTPVIDEGTRALYLDAMIDHGGSPEHAIVGLSLDSGEVLPGWPINVAEALRAKGMSFDPGMQNQRGALALVGDRLYVPFGGHYGDCGDYHGWVVGLQVSQPRLLGGWKTGATKGGIWAPGGISFDGRFLFAATGNTSGAYQWSGGEAIIRLPPDLQWQPGAQDFFAPANWRELDDEDADLGGTSPLPIDLPAGQGIFRLLLALGKDGNAYLLNRSDLGGIGHPLVVQHLARAPIITAPAVYLDGDDVLVAFQGRSIMRCLPDTYRAGLVVLRVVAGHQAQMRVAWCASLNGGGAPIVTTTDRVANPIVWIVGAEGDNRLHGFRGDTGQPIFDGGGSTDGMTNLRHLATLLAAGGHLYVAGDGRVHAFSFTP